MMSAYRLMTSHSGTRHGDGDDEGHDEGNLYTRTMNMMHVYHITIEHASQMHLTALTDDRG